MIIIASSNSCYWLTVYDKVSEFCIFHGSLHSLIRRKRKIRTLLQLEIGSDFSCLVEMVGFEPTCPIKDKTISSRSRYDRFDTSPYISLYSIAKKRFSVNTFLPLRHGCKPYAAVPFCVFGAESAVSLQKRLFFWAGAEYNRNDIFQI